MTQTKFTKSSSNTSWSAQVAEDQGGRTLCSPPPSSHAHMYLPDYLPYYVSYDHETYFFGKSYAFPTS